MRESTGKCVETNSQVPAQASENRQGQGQGVVCLTSALGDPDAPAGLSGALSSIATATRVKQQDDTHSPGSHSHFSSPFRPSLWAALPSPTLLRADRADNSTVDPRLFGTENTLPCSHQTFPARTGAVCPQLPESEFTAISWDSNVTQSFKLICQKPWCDLS